MNHTQELATEKYFKNYPEMESSEEMAAAPTARRSSSTFVRGAIVCTVLAVVVAGGVFWMQSSGKSKNPGADFFLWITGSKLTWEQYQQQQRKQGNTRLDESEYDWQQQLFHDAYSRR